jgi:hypothetical protein
MIAWAGHLLWILFGPGTWGSGGNMVAWVICGCIGFGWLHAKEKARHIQRLAQAAAHHKELLAQADAHHAEMKQQLAAHCADVKEHVTTVADGPVSGGAGSNPAGAGLPADGPVVPPPATRKGGDRM